MSGQQLAPSRSTVYVSNLPFNQTNNDLHQLFSKFGKIVKVTIVKDKERRSKGVAFVLFLNEEDAQACVNRTDGTQLKGRTLSCSIAKDNSRATEFIRRKEYLDKSRCYECGAEGHLSYKCPRNSLGDREPPPKRKRKPFKHQAPKAMAKPFDGKRGKDSFKEEEEEEEEGEDPLLESLSLAIHLQQEKVEEEKQLSRHSSGGPIVEAKCRRIRKSAYFSDEEEEASE